MCARFLHSWQLVELFSFNAVSNGFEHRTHNSSSDDDDDFVRFTGVFLTARGNGIFLVALASGDFFVALAFGASFDVIAFADDFVDVVLLAAFFAADLTALCSFAVFASCRFT